MKGHKFLIVTGILMIISSIFSIIVGVFVGGLGALAAGAGAASGLTFNYYAVLLLTLAGGICQLIAGIVGVKHSKSTENAKKCVAWGIVVIVFAVLSNILSVANGNSFNVANVLTGLLVPGLYIYGAILNSKVEAE